MDANSLGILFVECCHPFGHTVFHQTGCIGNRRGCRGCWPWKLSKRMEKEVVDHRKEDFDDHCDRDLIVHA